MSAFRWRITMVFSLVVLMQLVTAMATTRYYPRPPKIFSQNNNNRGEAQSNHFQDSSGEVWVQCKSNPNVYCFRVSPNGGYVDVFDLGGTPSGGDWRVITEE